MYSLDGKSALITGASSGIGRELALQLGGRARCLVLVARSEAPLTELAEKIPCATRVVPVDLVAEGSVQAVTDAVDDLEIDVLINNAGIGLGGRFPGADEAQLSRLLELNITALVKLTRRFLPGMLERGHGAILNVGSTAGYQGTPFLVAYGATKAFVNHFSEGLAWELRGTGVAVTLLSPGPTQTGFFKGAGIAPEARAQIMQSPEQVAAVGLRALEQRRVHCISGWTNRLMVGMQRVMPRRLIGMFAYHWLRPASDDGHAT